MTAMRSLAWTGLAVGVSIVIAQLMRRGHRSREGVDEGAVGWGVADDIAQAVSPVLPHEANAWNAAPGLPED